MKKIILVDDDPGILEIFKVILERAGYTVTTFINAQLILSDMFDEPDIFIIDKQLSGVDGVEVCNYLKKRHLMGTTPIIIFSANAHVHKFAKEAGADGSLEKPFKTKELLNMVEKLTAT